MNKRGKSYLGNQIKQASKPHEHDWQHVENGPTWELVRCTKCGEEQRNFND